MVTGSNIPRVQAEGALPVQTITRDELIRGGIETAQDLLDRISAHQSFGAFSEASGVGTLDPAKGWGYTGASLRGLGSQRTLVLLNGRRLAPYAYSGNSATDLSAIPVSALERVEVLKDGASAIYGTDAIGGVINFILRSDFRGIEAGADYFATQHGGGDSWRANLATGFGNFERDGYNGFLFVDHQRQDRLGAAERESSRTAYRPDLGLDVTNRDSFPANISQPGHFGLRNPTIPPTGATAQSCLPPSSFPTAQFPAQCRFDYPAFIDAIPASDRTSIIGRLDHRLGADERFFAEATYYHGHSIQAVAPTPVDSRFTHTPMTLPPSSPYYPADFVRGAGGDPTLPIQVQYRTVELGPRVSEIRVDQARAVAGLRGARGGWEYEAALSYVANRQQPYDKNGLSEAAFGPLLRSGVVNPFGPNTPEVLEQMRAAQVSGRESDDRASQYGGDIKASRELMQLPAGPVALALGLEGRRERLEMTNADFLYTGDIVGGNGALPSFSASGRKVASLFAEADIPVAASLESGIAARVDHYSDFGTTANPKLMLRWTATKGLLLRASFGTGFRAPTLYELFLPSYPQGVLGNLRDPVRCPVTRSDDDCHADMPFVGGGNRDLEPERSRQLNVGGVYEPTRGFSMAADYYRVRLRNVISPMTVEAALATYNVRKPPDAQHPDLPGAIDYLRNVQYNAGTLDTSGVDVDLRWRVPTQAGRFTLSLAGTYVATYRPDESKVDTGYPTAGRRSDGYGAIARWRHYAAIDWEGGAWGATVAQAFQSGYNETFYGACDDSGHCGDRRVGSYSVLDLQARYTGIRRLTAAFGIRNLLDRAPPATGATGTHQVGIDPSYADARGRMGYASLRYAWR